MQVCCWDRLNFTILQMFIFITIVKTKKSESDLEDRLLILLNFLIKYAYECQKLSVRSLYLAVQHFIGRV